MSWILSCLFFLALAYSSYLSAKRSGLWSWKEFAIVIVTLVSIPLFVTFVLAHIPWLADKPVWFTLIDEVVLFLSVWKLAMVLRKHFPTAKNPRP
jgi:hypothetical protein